MKKNFTIAILTIMTVLSLIFGFYQKSRADKIEAKLSQELLNNEKLRKSTEGLIQDIQRQNNSIKKK